MSTSKGTPGRRLGPLDSRQCREAIVALEKGRKKPTLTDRSGNTKQIIVTHYCVGSDPDTQHPVLEKDGKRVVPCDGEGDIFLKDVAKKHFLSAPSLVNEGIIVHLLQQSYFLYPPTAGRLPDIVASAAQEVFTQRRAPVVAAGAGDGDGVNRRLFLGAGAASGGGGGGRLKTTGLDDDSAGTGARCAGGGAGAGMMVQYQQGGTAGAGDRGTGGGGFGAAAGGTPVHHRHLIETSPQILSPEQHFQRQIQSQITNNTENQKQMQTAQGLIANTLKGLTDNFKEMGTTVNQHTGQIGDLQGEQKALKADNRELRDQLTQQGEEQYQLGQEVGELQETAEEHRRRLESIEQHSRLLIQIFMRVAECAIGIGLLPDDLKSSALGLYSKLESSGLNSYQDYLFTSVQWNSDSSLVSKGIGNGPKYRWELKSFVVMTTEDFGEQQEGSFRGSTHVVVKRPVHAFKLPFPVEEAPLRCQYIYPPLQRFTQINIFEFKDEDVDHWLLGAFRVDGEKTFILVEENFSFHGFGGEECG